MPTCRLGTFPPCNCGKIDRPMPNHPNLQQWLPQANTMGKQWGMNPVTLLAIASIETEGRKENWDIGNGAYGIVQVTRWYLNPYNCFNGTSYKLTDLAAKGPTITDPSEAVRISFDILGKFLRTFNDAHSSFKLSATAWNGTGCGWSGKYLDVWPSSDCANTAVKDPKTFTCYGLAAFDIAASYSPYWIDSTGRPNSYYFGNLSPAPCCQIRNVISIGLGGH